MAADYKLQNLGSRTRLDYVATADTSGAAFFIKLMVPFFKLFSTIQLKRFMKSLKACAEAEAAPAQVVA